MNAHFTPLASLELRHPYFADGRLSAVHFLMSSQSAALLRSGGLLVRENKGLWQLLMERDQNGPRVSLREGSMLWLGIVPTDPAWMLVTEPMAPDGQAALVGNFTRFDALDAAQPVQLTSGIHVLALASVARPVTVTLRRGAAEVLATLVVRGAGDSASLDLRDLPEGLYQVEQDDGLSPPVRSRLLVHPALQAARAPLVVGLQLSAALAGAAVAPVWRVDFAASAQPLEYYVVARQYAAQEFDQLQVSDRGFTDEGRPAILFDRLEQAAFDPASSLSPEQMGAAAGARIALFRSRAPVQRRERARRHLQLARNGDVLIDHLPQPDTSRATSQFVIHLSKP